MFTPIDIFLQYKLHYFTFCVYKQHLCKLKQKINRQSPIYNLHISRMEV